MTVRGVLLPLVAGALAAFAARALWPALPIGPLLVLAAMTMVAAAALLEARRRPEPSSASAPAPGGNLLARQLRASAVAAEAQRFQRFARDAPLGVVFIGRDGAVQFANDEYLRIVGRSREALEAERFQPAPSAPTQWLRPDLGPRHESEYVREDGTRVPVLVALSTQQDGLAAFVLDLTSQQAAQRAYQESEARFRTIAERLAEADRRKDEFLGVLSHELRNPLAPIRNAVFLLRRGEPADVALRAKMLGVVERQVNHLTRLVDDLLDVTRITRGRIELRRERVDLAGLLRRTGEDHRAMANERGLQLVTHVPDTPAVVDGDPTRLMQIVGNLLQNAVKFSPPGGTVSLALAVRDGAAEIHVTDTGVGIDEALVDHVFEPFVQAERTLARSGGGLGLGLALVKGLTEMHDGSVGASSAGPGRGAEFLVRLPLAPAEPEAAQHVPAAALAGRGGRCARVLVVEDNQEVANSLRDLVEAFGHEVEVARSGDAALAKARQRPPDVVLCDIGLPGMSGYDVARAFRRDPELRRARLVAVSGYAQAEDRREAAEAGFDRHVAKPPDPAELERLLAT